MKLFNLSKIIIGCCFCFLALQGYSQEIERSIFITANTGGADNQNTLRQIVNDAQQRNNSTLLIVGNITKKKGFDGRSTQELVKKQLTVLEGFNGNVIITSGHHEWKTNGHKGVRNLEKFIKKNSNAKFYPSNGFPIKKKDLSENVVLITIDSQWFLEDWNNHIYLNEGNEIKNRTLFFLEFENLIKKAQNKIKIIAIHHPVFTNSTQGFLGNTGGLSLQDFQNKQYKKLRNRLTTIARQTENIIFVSGHDKNLQYINKHGIPQIISGASGKTENVKKAAEGDFTSAKTGYTRLDIYSDGKSIINFHSLENKTSTSVFSTTIIKSEKKETSYDLKPKSSFDLRQKAAIYTKEETSKSKLYRSLWGEHYREYYGKLVNTPVVFLDTLWGGLTPLKRGGGQQSKSLRLEDKNGKQFVMRALRKSTIKFLQANAFQDTYIGDALDDSAIDKFLLDFYTTSHPYTSFAIGKLTGAADIFHTNALLYYIPKQEILGAFNDEFGDELYMIEEHVGDTQKDLASFGKPKKILSTTDVLQEIHRTGKSAVDEPSYIRARLFDMLIGDWDRHEDQWRWAMFKKEDGTKIYKPIPRDRDQAFSIYDGSLLSFLTRAVPGLRKMQSYDHNLRSPKWFALSPYHLDLNLINSSEWSEWEKQAKYLQANITDAVIEQAFEVLPEEIKGETINDLKTKLKGRRSNIVDIARRYYTYLNKFEVIVGTQKGDKFKITRHPEGKTTIDIHRKDLGIFNRTFTHDITKEIWIYGLDGKDTFIVDGKGDDLITIKIIGGKKNDIYDFKNTRKIKLYDYKSKENTIINKNSKKWLVDDYSINNFDHKKGKHGINQILPLIAVNPDDGLQIGILNNYTFYGLQTNPFTQKHSFSASYYTGTSGYDVSYKGEFSNIFHNWNFGVEGKYTSPNFARNFFGFGNETEYDKEIVELDFNRVRIRQWKAALALIWRGRDGGAFHFKPLIESFEVENTDDRFINSLPSSSTVFEQQTYGGVEIAYKFKNKDNMAFPTLGLDFGITAGYKTNIDGGDSENSFAYIKPHLAIDQKLSKNGRLVLATKIGSEIILGDDFEFYHAAELGGNHSLRGFRNERFTGKYSLYQNTDLRMVLGRLKTSIIPLKYGISGSFDYGRIWLENDNSDKWHNSVGGSFWVSGLDTFTANIGYYGSDDGGRIVFIFGFAF